jgi:hypothetical protein
MEPWLLTTPKFEELSEALNAAIANKWMPEAAADSPVGPRAAFSQGYAHPQISVHRGVAFARIHGVMGRGLSALDMECGGFDTGMFREQLKLISEDSSVKALIIDFNTPGGMANGNMAVCKDLRALSESGVKVYAYVGLMCASAGYFVASACDEIHAHPDAIVGSISTIYSGIDSSSPLGNSKRRAPPAKNGPTRSARTSGAGSSRLTPNSKDSWPSAEDSPLTTWKGSGGMRRTRPLASPTPPPLTLARSSWSLSSHPSKPCPSFLSTSVFTLATPRPPRST